MKKIILTLLLIVSFASTYGQSKWHKQQNEVFVEAAAKEYNLDDAQKEKLYDARMKMMMSYKESNQAVENGEITKDEVMWSSTLKTKFFKTMKLTKPMCAIFLEDLSLF